jgi:hypothetical protein
MGSIIYTLVTWHAVNVGVEIWHVVSPWWMVMWQVLNATIKF